MHEDLHPHGEGSDSVAQLIETGREYPAESLQTASNQIRLQCISVYQRNWTRVGVGMAREPGNGESSRFFLKQNIGKNGLWHDNHWEYEQAGAIIAHKLFSHLVRVPALRYKNESLLLNVFDYIDVVTVDEQLRSDPACFDRSIASVIGKMVQVLEVMRQPPAEVLEKNLPVKHRSYGSPGKAVCFKGFDIRNAGFIRMDDGRLNTDDLAVFDFVRPYLAPIEEAAAKLFVSIGLLNWGKPLSRFMQGPDLMLLEKALLPMAPYMDKNAVQAELKLQSTFRTQEFQGAGRLERAIKRLGVDALGKRYLRKLARWCDRHIN